MSSRASLHVEVRANPEGLPMEVFDKLRSGITKDRSQFYKDVATPFYGADGQGAKVSQGAVNQFWLWSMRLTSRTPMKGSRPFSETDFTDPCKGRK